MKLPFSIDRLSKAYAERHEPEQYTQLAQTYWALLLVGSLFLALAGVAYGSWQFIAAPAPSTTDVPTQGTMSFNQAQLKEIVEYFEKRQAEFQNMMSQ